MNPERGAMNPERAKSGLEDVTRTAEFSSAVPSPNGGSTGQVAPFDVGRVRKIGSDDGFCSTHGQVARATRPRVSQLGKLKGTQESGLWSARDWGTSLSFLNPFLSFPLSCCRRESFPCQSRIWGRRA